MNKKNKIQKRFIFGLLIIFSVLILVSNVSAYKRLCLNDGESVPSSSNPRYTCHSTLCEICVTDNNFPTHPGFCNSAAGCGVIGPGSNDLEPPVLTVNTPQDGAIYGSRTVPFDLIMSEPSSILYIDNINGRGMWKKLVSNAKYFRKGVSFSDGPVDITIKAIDSNGNSVTQTRKFNVDSTKPKIKLTEPKKGFSDGTFRVTITEKNPKELLLIYGNLQKGDKSAVVNLASCQQDKTNQICEIYVNLMEFNNQQINYHFKLTDIGNNVVESKPIAINVDNVNPIITNEGNMYEIQGKSVLFNISVTDQNFYQVDFIDNNQPRPKITKLCSSLKNSFCVKKQSFSVGTHELNIRVSDKAGNINSKTILFDII